MPSIPRTVVVAVSAALALLWAVLLPLLYNAQGFGMRGRSPASITILAETLVVTVLSTVFVTPERVPSLVTPSGTVIVTVVTGNSVFAVSEQMISMSPLATVDYCKCKPGMAEPNPRQYSYR
jgi:hypothetical protein